MRFDLDLGKLLVRRCAPLIVITAALLLQASTPALAAEPCLNEALRAEDPYSPSLPDCRAYEQVSPVEKGLTDALGDIVNVRAAASGEAVTFTANTPFPGGIGGASQPHLLSTRASAGWLTQSLQPPTSPGSLATVKGVTEDLAYTFSESPSEPPLSPGASEGRKSFYLRTVQTGAYTLVAQASPGERNEFMFVGAADDDSRIFFETVNQLLPEAPAGVTNLYEWHEGQLSLVDVLPPEGGVPGEVPPRGVFAGSSVRVGAGGVTGDALVQGAVSEGGTRVFFTDLETGRLYAREPQAGRTIAVSAGAASWLGATPNGSQVIYSEGAGVDANLYRFTVEDERREALTSGSAGVVGVMGIGGDGAYVYFAATGALASGASEAKGHANLYLEHEGSISFVTGLEFGPREVGEANVEANEDNWSTDRGGETGSEFTEQPSDDGRSSRVSPDGRTLLFAIVGASPTSYQSGGHIEIYLYDAASGRISCVSCNPSGAPASSNAELFVAVPESHALPLDPGGLPRNLSEDGKRVFFETDEALVPQDGNGQLDVYEWEAEGEGVCPSGRGAGCVYLISSGQSTEPSYFAEASASGNDVFFFTRQSLVGQDTDTNIDVYDARVGGGIAAQNQLAPLAPCLGEACRPAQNPAPALGVPVSQVFSGPDGPAPPAESKVVTNPKPKALTRAQKLTKALKACRKKSKRQRADCESQARKRYGAKAKVIKSDRKGR
jgi:hypothetical protein